MSRHRKNRHHNQNRSGRNRPTSPRQHRPRPAPQVYVGDINNGWPDPQAPIGIVSSQLSIAVSSRDQETDARLTEIEQIRLRNRLIAMFPFNIVAHWLGIRPRSFFGHGSTP